MQSELKTFINSNPDPRELKRALAVQMVQQGYAYRDIQAVLQVSIGFVTKWKQRYEAGRSEQLTPGVSGTQKLSQ
jgi:hypothetical protein